MMFILSSDKVSVQVLCDILRSGGLPEQENGHQPPLYFAPDDLEYQAAFPSKRLGMGSFRIALESIFNRIHHDSLEYVSFGKPKPFVFKNIEALLTQLQPSHCHIDTTNTGGDSQSHAFKIVYMIGDSPSVDVKGAGQVKGLLKDRRLEALVDADLEGNYIDDEVEQLIHVALFCTQGSPPGQRPKMSEVVRILEGDGLEERWEKWQKEEMFRQDINIIPHPSTNWIIDSSSQIPPDELSGPR